MKVAPARFPNRAWLAAATAALFSLAGCHRPPDRAPPRATGVVEIEPQTSELDVPISARLATLSAALEEAIPRRLWTIDKPNQACVPSRSVKILFAKIKTPTLSCHIIGQVTRGPLRLSGKGRILSVTMPIHASVSARDIGHVLHGETAVGDAQVRADTTLDIAPDWSPRGSVDIHYDWTDEPHIDFLGQRIEFTSRADTKLRGVVGRLEQTLPRELARLHVRDQAEAAWRSAFTSLQVNRSRPPVWLRIAPQAMSYGGYRVEGQMLVLRLGMTARTETFVGPRPADPAPTPLPALTKRRPGTNRVVFALPVIAAYEELEPVLARALAKRASRPFHVPGIGPVLARFAKVTVYGTTGGRIAVGLAFSAATEGGSPSHGTVWLTALPINAPNSRRVAFTQLQVSGVTDSTGTNLLLRLANAPTLSTTLSDALTQNFSDDYDKLLTKVSRSISVKRTGSFVIRARIDDVETGQIQALGQGVYLPVRGRGTASVSVDVPEAGS
ncbi:DUF4403 family protein [Sphingomonas aerophila]|uniref:DUF4403 family protein n=1 Tax=Sphingomonas aerophila TaxID=1344948 RepID=A0A7W9BFA6_9SPHN|nr:DUF4403 family protein [Sphingomonas aerophila]MBB5715826.1 hypothetical protein [Sphingomonas aerophila]